MSREETGSHTAQNSSSVQGKYSGTYKHMCSTFRVCASFIMGVNSMTRHKTLRESRPYSSALKLFSLPAAVNSIIIYTSRADEGVYIHSGTTPLAVSSTQIQTHTLIHKCWSPLRCQRSAYGLVEPLFSRAHILLRGGLLLL